MKMTLPLAMNAYAKNDKEHFPCQNGADDNDRPSTLFFADFCVAEVYGESAIRDTFNRCAQWKNNAKMWTELTIVLNNLLWWHHQDGELPLAKLYDKLWREADEHAATFTGDDATYYYTITD